MHFSIVLASYLSSNAIVIVKNLFGYRQIVGFRFPARALRKSPPFLPLGFNFVSGGPPSAFIQVTWVDGHGQQWFYASLEGDFFAELDELTRLISPDPTDPNQPQGGFFYAQLWKSSRKVLKYQPTDPQVPCPPDAPGP